MSSTATKLTQKEIKAALKPLTWDLTIRSDYIGIHSLSDAQRAEAMKWIESHLQVELISTGYVNKDYRAFYNRT